MSQSNQEHKPFEGPLAPVYSIEDYAGKVDESNFKRPLFPSMPRNLPEQTEIKNQLKDCLDRLDAIDVGLEKLKPQNNGYLIKNGIWR